MATPLKIGLDFDNTLVTYDEVFLAAAREQNLLEDSFRGNKRMVRDAIRLLSDGELSWQKLQGHVYGKGLTGATMFKGVDAFLRRCRRERIPLTIVSHKTEYGHFDPDRTNLRNAAREWMRANGFFRADIYGISEDDVYFEGTRAEKIARIARIGCTHFVDDLIEVLDDPDFPQAVQKILLADDEHASDATADYVLCRDWRDVEKAIFGADN